MFKGILYYSHNTLDGSHVNNTCRASLIESELPITSVTHEPIDLGTNIIFDGPSTLGSMIEQIILGLESMTEDYVYLAEHDCIYHPSHYTIDSSSISYNNNMWRLTPFGYVKIQGSVLSACSGPRQLLLEAMKDKLITYKERESQYIGKPYVKMLYEPGRGVGRSGKATKCYIASSELPSIDVRHRINTTERGWGRRHAHVQTLPYWGDAVNLRRRLNI